MEYPNTVASKGSGKFKVADEIVSQENSSLERLIKAGKVAPRVTPQKIDDVIADVYYYVFPNTTLTICVIELVNGFNVTGQSAAASPENFDADYGKELAFVDARRKIYELEGYLLKQRLYEAEIDKEASEALK